MKSKVTTRVSAIVSSTVLIAGLLFLSEGAAVAAAPPSDGKISQTALDQRAEEADARGYIVVAPSEGQEVGDATFYPTGPIADDTLVVIADPDGSLPNGLTTERLDALVAESRLNGGVGVSMEVDTPLNGQSLDSVELEPDMATAAETYYAWSATSTGYSREYFAGSQWGFDEYAQASYYFYTASGFGQYASGNGLGYYRGYNGSTFGTWSKWYYVGTATTTGAGRSVPWGNVAANKLFKAICTNVYACWGNVT